VKPAQYAETRCKSALNRVQGMPFAWSLNPYAGCRHGCSYCYARRYHEWLDRSPADFDSQILVKTNVVAVLRAELRRPSWRREHVALGTATDPYQPVEGRYRLTRGCLEAFRDHASPVGVTTKGTLIVRDLDVLQDLGDLAEVHFSVITLDPELARRLEPGAPAPARRLAALERLASAGVACSVFVAPVLPGLTDGPEELRALYRTAAAAGARSVHAMPLRLQGAVKPYFLQALESEFPALASSYRRGYRHGSNAPPEYQQRLRERVTVAKAEAGLPPEPARHGGAARRHGEQLALPV
jgi:DNA repair photolyase